LFARENYTGTAGPGAPGLSPIVDRRAAPGCRQTGVFVKRAEELARARRDPMNMDIRIYMLLIALLIAVFALIGWFVLSASFRAHERRRKALDSRWRMRQRWEAGSVDGFGHG
jgi:hypothetical protein